MKVLITGAGGFVGQHLVDYLLDSGSEVVAVSRFPSARPVSCRWVLSPGTEAEWHRLLVSVTAVVHLAGLAHRAATRWDRKAHQQEMMKINFAATSELYQTASRCGVSRFLFLSSIAALTSRSVGQLGDDTPPWPISPYGISKLAADRAIEDGARNGGCPFTILRPPMIYGRGNSGNIAALTKLVKSGVPLPFRSLTNRRSFLYVGNLCDVVHRCLRSPAAANRRFLVSDGADVSTPELIRLIAASANVPCRLFSVPESVFRTIARFNPDGALAKLVGSLYLDIEPLKKALDWKPPFSVNEGLASALSAATPGPQCPPAPSS